MYCTCGYDSLGTSGLNVYILSYTFDPIFIQPHINVSKNTLQYRGPMLFFSYNHINKNIKSYGENSKNFYFEAAEIKYYWLYGLFMH